MDDTLSPEPPRRIGSLAELAKLAGLSSATVSRALSDHWSVNADTKARVRALAQHHGFQPNQLARNLRLRRTQTIGLVLPLGHETGQHLSDPFFLSLLGHLADRLTERGYDITLSRVLPTSPDWLDRVVDSGRIDGLILIGQSDQLDTIERVAARYAKLVVWGAALPGCHHLTVGTDNLRGGAMATRHLIETGRRRLAFAGNVTAPEFAQRHQGFLDTAAGAGVATETLAMPMTPDAAYAALAARLAAGDPPDAIFAASDVVAMSALRAAAERGLRVPHDLAVIGFDDVLLAAHTSPALSTVRQDLVRGAEAMIDRLFARMAGEPASSCVIAPELVVRGSTAAAG